MTPVKTPALRPKGMVAIVISPFKRAKTEYNAQFAPKE